MGEMVMNKNAPKTIHTTPEVKISFKQRGGSTVVTFTYDGEEHAYSVIGMTPPKKRKYRGYYLGSVKT